MTRAATLGVLAAQECTSPCLGISLGLGFRVLFLGPNRSAVALAASTVNVAAVAAFAYWEPSCLQSSLLSLPYPCAPREPVISGDCCGWATLGPPASLGYDEGGGLMP